MGANKKTVLITGCSEGGLGAALALAFHQAGLHVCATGRDKLKMKALEEQGIQVMIMDVLSSQSIAACTSALIRLDILVNNAGASYSMPISDMVTSEAKDIFELNLWAQLAVTKAMLPLLLRSNGIIVNQTSVMAVAAVPFQAAYNASKAAFAMFSECLRLELSPFGVKVIDLKTGAVASNLIRNQKVSTTIELPHDSIYAPAREAVQAAMRNDKMADAGMPAQQWAMEVVADVIKKNPPAVIWRGTNARLARFGTIMPHGALDSTIKKMTGLDVVEQQVRRS